MIHLDESIKGKIAKTVLKGVAKGVKKIVKGNLPKKAAYGKGQQGSFLTRQKDKLAKQTGYNPGKDYGKSYNPNNPGKVKTKAEIASERGRGGEIEYRSWQDVDEIGSYSTAKRPFTGKLKTKSAAEKAARQKRVKEMEKANRVQKSGG